MFKIFENGKELTINIFKPGSYFPMLWAIGNISNDYYYQAITAVEVFRTPKEDLLTFLNHHPDELMSLTRRILSGLDKLIVNMQVLLNGDADKKISSILTYLARNLGEKKENTICISVPLTHQDVANYSGVSRETTSLILKKMEINRQIIFNKHFIEIYYINGFTQKQNTEKDNYSEINVV